ncbi:glycosyl transferase [Plantactinospora sp. BC1]|uniref:glycosyltransferase family 9 protein n=1 Tax=Plantactinospora sp. BC1 TaxID=2108470 RepID=UPI000D1709D6|nr:glycosyltransferase family 9 protein [Plantactinospora sp. BC1]AVT29365.1 glycosyl transferase [Plantactinospora sp. BC1]
MILVLRALGIGDLATAVPALRALRAAFARERLVLAAPRWLGPLVELVGGIDEQVDVDGLGPYRWPPMAPERAVNLHGRGPQSHRLLRAAQPRQLMAFACAEAGHHVGPVWRPDEHEVARWCRLLDWYGIATDPSDLALHRPTPGELPVGASIVHPGAKAVERRWPPDRFAAVARELARRGHRVLVTGAPGERDLAEEVAARAGLPGSAVLAGRTDVGELAALVAHGRLVVAGDTGIGHLATAYGTASVLLFGPVSPALWGPPADRLCHRALWAGPAIGWRLPTPDIPAARQPGREPSGQPEPAHRRKGPAPTGSGPHPALASLRVADVLAAVEEVERTGPGAVAGR